MSRISQVCLTFSGLASTKYLRIQELGSILCLFFHLNREPLVDLRVASGAGCVPLVPRWLTIRDFVKGGNSNYILFKGCRL